MKRFRFFTFIFLYVASVILLSPLDLYSQGTWTQKANFGGMSRMAGVGFSIGNKGYTGVGSDFFSTCYTDFWEWNQSTDVWTQKANFGGIGRYRTVGFSIGNKGYIGTGYNAGGTQDFWEWDQATNVWTQKANFAGGIRYEAVGFSIGTKGYIGTGTDGTTRYQDFWEWNQSTNVWTQKANLGGLSRIFAVGFSIGGKGYIGTGLYWTGSANVYLQDFWEWDQTTNVWTQKANFSGAARVEATAFTIGSYGYVGTGTTSLGTGTVSDFWKYNPSTNLWTSIPSFGGGLREHASGFSIGCRGYVTNGFINDQTSTNTNDLWEYFDTTNTTCICSNYIATISGNSSICSGQSATLTANPSGGTYAWSNGSTSKIISVTPTSTSIYSVVVSIGSCLDTTSISVTVKPPPVASISGITSVCTGQNSTLIASGGTNYSWSNGFTSSQIIVSPTSNTTYTVSVSNGLCTSDTNISILVNPSPIAIISGNTKLCLGQNTTLAASGGGNYLWSNGETNNSIFITPTASTNYFVTVTSTNGCADTANANIVITQMPVATINPNTTICEGTIITLNAGGGTTYLWSNGQTNTSILASPSTSTTYSVVAANGNCKDSIATIITVNPNPIASISSNINIFQGQSAILNASGGNMYLWNNGNTDSIITVMPNATTKYCVTVTDTSINRCTDTACVTVFVESPCDTAGTFFFPNAFSPNNDGENDALKIYYNEMNCISTLHLIIYDRWGELIYETSDKNFSWDGTYPGKPLNTQVLAYHLTVGFTDGKAINRKGNVSLVR